MYATGTVAPGSFGPHAGTGHGGSGRSGPMQVPGTVAETAPRPPSSGMAVSSTGWGGGEAAVGAAGQLPALLVDGSVVGPAPGQGPVAAGEDAAAVAHGQGHPLGGLDDPGRPADLQGLAGRSAQH